MSAASATAAIGKACELPRTAASVLFFLLFLVSGLPARAATPGPLSALRTARQVHVLPFAVARRGLPVHLARAQVTYFQPSFGVLFLMDKTDGIYAHPQSGEPLALRIGDIVAVDGITAPGDVAPVIERAHFRILGHAPLPSAPMVSFDRLSSGAYDSRWVTVEGILHSVDRPRQRISYEGTTTFDQNDVVLSLSSGQQQLKIVVLAPSPWDPSPLIDAKVSLRVAVGSLFNKRKQFTGVHLFMPGPQFLEVLQPPPAHPFALPLTSVTGISRASAREPGHRVHIRGVVTSAYDDQHFSLMDSEHGIFVTAQLPSPVHLGDLLDVIGFPAQGEYTLYLDGALIRRLGSAPLPAPVPLTPDEAYSGIYDAEPIELQGLLLDRYGSGSAPRALRLSDAGRTFLAVLPPGSPVGAIDSLRVGSRLRLHGICVIHTGVTNTPQSMDLLLRSAADIRVLHAASWWTPRYTLILAAGLSLLVLIITTRNLGLRRRVIAQTRQIQAQLDASRALRLQAEAATHEKSQTLASLLTTQHDLLLAQEKLRFQATHDALTGLWNRAALLDFLHREIERALRTRGSLGVLLLDVDHFKPVNDTYGHLAGDAVLCEIASRLTRSTRPYDIAGRYGGEEFLILLPNCDCTQAEHSAERIREAIGALPFHAGDADLSLTVSIGATVAFGLPEFDSPELEKRESDAELLSRADSALYEAKATGRNRTVLHLPDPVALTLPSCR